MPVKQTCNVERRLQDVYRLGIDCQLLFPNHSGVCDKIADAGEANVVGRQPSQFINLGKARVSAGNDTSSTTRTASESRNGTTPL